MSVYLTALISVLESTFVSVLYFDTCLTAASVIEVLGPALVCINLSVSGQQLCNCIVMRGPYIDILLPASG
jgi:hypothetical protein